MMSKTSPYYVPLGLDRLFERFPDLSIRPSKSSDLAIADQIVAYLEQISLKYAAASRGSTQEPVALFSHQPNSFL